MSLSHQRCYHHAAREAAVRCPECGRFFCRECVSEHDDRMLCAECLATLNSAPTTTRFQLLDLVNIVRAAVGVLIVWSVFYGIGRLLLTIPTAFHEGTLWRKVFW